MNQIEDENIKKEQDEMKQELKLFMGKSKTELLEMLKDVGKLEEKES